MGAESNVGACTMGGESSSAIIAISPLRGLAVLVPQALMTAAAEPAIIVRNARRFIFTMPKQSDPLDLELSLHHIVSSEDGCYNLPIAYTSRTSGRALRHRPRKVGTDLLPRGRPRTSHKPAPTAPRTIPRARTE